MTKPNLGRLALALALFVIVLGGLPFLKGGFYLGKHEGDTLQLAELVLRMADGQIPHYDFMTPIGILAIAPMALFVHLGQGLGHAIFSAQLLVAVLLFPAVLRVGMSRLSGFWPYAYGAVVLLFCVALVHGEAQRAVSISMHYNRWAWAIVYVIVPLAVLAPERHPRPTLDGMLIGLGLAALVLMKVTYFVSLAPGIAIALLARKNWRMMGAALVAGLVVAAVVTLILGPHFWLAYVHDLATVAGSETRPEPGEPFGVTIASPPFMGGSLALIATVIFLRQAGRAVEGMVLLFLMPGFFYIVYQNWGNDPQWLMLLGMLALVLRPEPGTVNGWNIDLRDALRITGILAIAFGAPSTINLLYSPFRHAASDTKDMVRLLPMIDGQDDIFTFEPRLYKADLRVADDGPGQAFEAYRKRGQRKDGTMLNGEKLPECEQENGMSAWFETVDADLTKAGYGGKAILGTDLFSLYWAFGDFKTVKGAAPWYYGGLSGVENADYLLVPLCPGQGIIRDQMLKNLNDGGWTLTEVQRTDLYILVKPSAPKVAD